MPPLGTWPGGFPGDWAKALPSSREIDQGLCRLSGGDTTFLGFKFLPWCAIHFIFRNANLGFAYHTLLPPCTQRIRPPRRGAFLHLQILRCRFVPTGMW